MKKNKSALPWHTKPLGIVAKIVIFAVVFGSARYITALIFKDRGNGSASEQVQTLLSSDAVKEYVSTEHKFRINFPGFPAIERDTLDVSGYQIPYTIYSRETDNGNKAYLVSVADYSQFAEYNERSGLEGALNGAAQNNPGSKLISSEFFTYAGHQAIEGHFTATIEEKFYDFYMRGVAKNKIIYGVLTVGESGPAFKTFADSLKFD
jgi:hypothetical protein